MLKRDSELQQKESAVLEARYELEEMRQQTEAALRSSGMISRRTGSVSMMT